MRRKKIDILTIGDVNSGKSTIVGQLIYKCGVIDTSELEKIRKESFNLKKRSLMFAWVLEKLRAEREIGDPVDTMLTFETRNYTFTFVDAPGHSSFIKNIIIGRSEADCAIVIFDATNPDMVNQTCELAHLVFTLGVKQMICCCNKMDDTTPKYSEPRFKKILHEVSDYLKKFGYDPDLIPFVPISGSVGDNMIEKSPKLSWYKGPTLLEALDQLSEPKRLSDKPLRLPLEGVYAKTLPCGTVATGLLKSGTVVTFAPSGSSTVFKSVKDALDNQPVRLAFPGRRVFLDIKNCAEVVKDLKRGHVASESNNDPAKGAVSFTALVIILKDLEPPAQICNGYRPKLKFPLKDMELYMAVELSSIQKKIDGQYGKPIKKASGVLKKDDVGIVKMIPTEPMVVETLSEYPPLGRFDVEDKEQIVAVGVIMSVDEDSSGSKPDALKKGSKPDALKKGSKPAEKKGAK